MKIHIVQKGDTLWKIAKKYGVNFEELKKMNSQLSNPDMIMPGMKIKVPTSGGSVKKEAPIGNVMGVKKEMPIAEMPFVKEQPKPLPVVEAPQKEAPIMPIKEAPIAPIMEAPKVPQPNIPDIDINNYYMVNMAKMNVHQPQLPPKPTNILPEAKEVPKEAPIKEMPKVVAPIAEAPQVELPQVESPIEGGLEQPMPEYCVPVSPILPGSGLHPGWCPPQPCPPYHQHFMPYPQPAMPYPQVQGATHLGMMPGVENPTYLAGVEESSSFMPQMPMMNPMGQNPSAVLGVEDIPNVPQNQPMGMAPAGFAPGPFAPYPDNCMPASPILPGPGFGNYPPPATPYVGAPYGGQQMPYGTQQMPYGAQQLPYGTQQMPFGGQQMPYGAQQMPFGAQQMPNRTQQMPVGDPQMQMQQMPFGDPLMQMQQMPFGDSQMQMQQMPIGDSQMPMQQMPFGDPQMQMQQMPFAGQQMPMQQMPYVGQQMPFGGQQAPFPQMPYSGQEMQGPFTDMESPEGLGMPQFPPHMSQGGMDYDCGCGGPKLPKAPINPFGQGMPGVYSPSYGQMAQPPYMNPYGYSQVPGPRDFDESSEFYR